MYKEFKTCDLSEFRLLSTSKGDQSKWTYGNYFIKADSLGYESIAETLVSKFLHYVSDVDFTDYHLCRIVDSDKSYCGCYSENFLRQGEQCRSLFNLLRTYYGSEQRANEQLKRFNGKERYEFVVDFLENVTGLDVRGYFGRLFAIDALILNEDRHMNNICVISGEEYWRLCPIFDNGLSLLSDMNDYRMNTPISVCVRKVKAKPFSTDFKKQWEYTSGSRIVIDFSAFCCDIENMTVQFKQSEFERAKKVLISRCKETEGYLWIQKQFSGGSII